MQAAQAFEVGRVRWSAIRVGDGVVNIAAHCGTMAAWEPARQVPATHEVGQGLRRNIARLRCGVVGMNQRPNLGRFSEFGDQIRRDQRIAADHRAGLTTVALDAGLIGDNVDDHR